MGLVQSSGSESIARVQPIRNGLREQARQLQTSRCQAGFSAVLSERIVLHGTMLHSSSAIESDMQMVTLHCARSSRHCCEPKRSQLQLFVRNRELGQLERMSRNDRSQECTPPRSIAATGRNRCKTPVHSPGANCSIGCNIGIIARWHHSRQPGPGQPCLLPCGTV